MKIGQTAAKISDYFWENTKPLLILFLVIATILYSISFVITNLEAISFLRNIASILIATTIFQFLLKSKGFLRVVNESMDHTKRQWSMYNDRYIKQLLETIKQTHGFFNFEFDKLKYDSINNAKNALIQQKKEAINRRSDDIALQKRCFFVKEIQNIRTIYKNGTEIVSFIAEIEMIENGLFSFEYTMLSNNPNSQFPVFNEYLKCQDRFCNYSFSAKTKNLPETFSNKDMQIEAVVDNEKEKRIRISFLKPFKAEDTFTLMFSITTPKEYTEFAEEYIKEGKNQPRSSSKYPIGLRHFTIQEEIYCSDEENTRFNPKLTINSKEIESHKIDYGLYYKVTKWTVYYDSNDSSGVLLSLF